MRDLESIDPEFHKSLQWMLDNDITDVIDQEFTIEDDQFGEQKIVELKEGGKSIPLTEENKEEYVRLVVQYRVENSIKDQIKAFLNGFYEIIPRNLIQIFEADQLERKSSSGPMKGMADHQCSFLVSRRSMLTSSRMLRKWLAGKPVIPRSRGSGEHCDRSRKRSEPDS